MEHCSCYAAVAETLSTSATTASESNRWLALESPTVGLTYEALANKIMKNGANDRRNAWSQDPDPERFTYGFDYYDELEQGV